MNTIDTTPLLHNIGAPPRTVVRYSGLSNVMGPADDAADPTPSPMHGTAIRFVLPADFDTASPAAILHSLGMSAADDPQSTLESVINTHADSLPLPGGCVVIPATDAHRILWPDALSALAILAKSSDNIWLRAKIPAVHGPFTRRQASLLVPPAFVARLGEKST